MQEKLLREIVLREISATTTYKRAATDCDKLVDEHLKFMTANRIVVQPECECLPLFYWLPKLHKNVMVLAASHKCTTKALSKLLTSCFK